jgi:tRNA1(Val) A37 N6-methylase TrmN6
METTLKQAYLNLIEDLKRPYKDEDFEMPLYVIDEINYYEKRIKEIEQNQY